MRKVVGIPLLLALSLLMALALAACGGASDSEETEDTSESAAPTAAAETPTEEAMEEASTPEAMDEEESDSVQEEQQAAEDKEEDASSSASDTKEDSSGEQKMMDVEPALKSLANDLAGGPGAIYIGDLNQLVGPATEASLGGINAEGDPDGSVPLESLERHIWIYDSPYYQDLLEKANLTNPTPLTSTGEEFKFQYACTNRALLPCQLMEHYLIPNIAERTNDQLIINLTSFPELGISGADNMTLVRDGTLDIAEIYTGYVAGEVPALEIQSLWGMFKDHKAQYDATTVLTPDLEQMIAEESGGSPIITHNWYVGIDQFFFCKEALHSPADFEGKKTRSHGAAISDWIEGMGAEAQFVAFAEVYTALERGILDCGVTGADPAYGQRWYEVTTHMNGFLVSLFNDNVVMNSTIFEKLPADLQDILIEEGAKHELEALRLAAIQNEVGIKKNELAGLINVPFSDELTALSDQAVLNNVVPGWIRRVGDNDDPIFDIFNEKITPIVGIRIEDDGTVVEVK